MSTEPLDKIPPLQPPRGEIPPSFWEQHGVWLIALGALLAGLAALAIWVFRRPKPARIIPPEVQARAALESLRQKTEDGALLSQVSQILKAYLIAAFGMSHGEFTTAEFCSALASHQTLRHELAAPISQFLRECDDRKFAPGAITHSLGAAARALDLVELAEVKRTQLRQAEDPAPQSGSPKSSAALSIVG